MTVGELKEMLKEYPDEMEVITDRYSDYSIVKREEWSVVKGVQRKTDWIMRSHSTMSEENKLVEKSYLHLEGN